MFKSIIKLYYNPLLHLLSHYQINYKKAFHSKLIYTKINNNNIYNNNKSKAKQTINKIQMKKKF